MDAPGGSAAGYSVLRTELELQRAVIARARSTVEHALTSQLDPEADGWSGPARLAFGNALDGVRAQASATVHALRLAHDLTEAALYEVDRAAVDRAAGVKGG